MPMTKDQILAEVAALNPAERAELAEDIRQIAEDDDLSPEQRDELRRRVDALNCGEASLIPGDQVMQELHEQLSRR